MIINTPPDADLQNYKKYCLRRSVQKTSSGLGFFIFSYYATMLFLSSVSNEALKYIPEIRFEKIPLFYLNIFISVFSAVLPAFIYFLFSNRKIAETVKVKYVKLGTLIPIIFIGMAVAMIANFASSIIISNFSVFGFENKVNFSINVSSIPEILLYIISSAVVPALAEEFAFRGVLMGALRKYGDVFAIITSSLLFGAMHGNITQIPFAFILGLIFAFVDCKTNSILPSIIIHFINNFYAVVLDILQSSGVLSKQAFFVLDYILVAAFCILGLLSFFLLIAKDKNYFKITDSNAQASSDSNCVFLSLKEKMQSFFINPGILFILILFLFETVQNIKII